MVERQRDTTLLIRMADEEKKALHQLCIEESIGFQHLFEAFADLILSEGPQAFQSVVDRARNIREESRKK